MSSAEQQGISGISVDVDHNPYLAEGAGTVDAIVSIAAPHDIACHVAAAGTGRSHRHRLLDLDAGPSGQVRRGETGHRGRRRRNRRRHLFHRPRRHRRGRARLSRGGSAHASQCIEQSGGGARRRRPTAQGRNRAGHLARLCPRRRGTTPGGAHPRDPAHRRQGRARDPRTARARKSASAKANSPAIAGEWGPIGRSTNCGRSPRHCWARWISLPIPPISRLTSRR